ncbi:energy-coupling factor ABC transporter permease [Rhodoferax antarcticus]|uniref:Putative membrane protein n=1 Tax=Rhodoferax antarcticus ANT.BR TaxID=1111071 RepID=A0A1Q8YGW2_9BURK|nr:energy-coupling factor ABC transporter permease [Rhodoferax antarcticus]APW45346.1 cobalt transporter [Rhodoferax antarcticus]OLP07226.1 putative membrane protein [Rhodoferax antarcticus ANT.BR]
MHIEPGLVEGTKIFLSYASAAGALGYAAKLSVDTVQGDGLIALLLRSAMATALVFCFFEVLPHQPVGVSEVHLILGTTLLLIFGVAPAAIGLAVGLLVQGLFFAPLDLPQYGMNVTTLLVPLFATAALAGKIIPKSTAYVDISYAQAFKLSVAYQGGIVVWVGFWALYGQGVGAENLASAASFGAAYMTIVLAEPLIDLGVLALAKMMHRLRGSVAVDKRLYSAA